MWHISNEGFLKLSEEGLEKVDQIFDKWRAGELEVENPNEVPLDLFGNEVKIGDWVAVLSMGFYGVVATSGNCDVCQVVNKFGALGVFYNGVFSPLVTAMDSARERCHGTHHLNGFMPRIIIISEETAESVPQK